MALGTPNWVNVNLQLGYPAPGFVDSGIVRGGTTYPSIPVGTVAQFRDTGTTGLGVGTFIFLPGVASTTAGDVVQYTVSDGAASGGSTTRWTGTGATGLPLAIATAATVASTWGWYQIGGAAIVNVAASVSAASAAYYGGTVSLLDDAQSNGKQVLNAFFASASDGGSPLKAVLTINAPFVQGQLV